MNRIVLTTAVLLTLAASSGSAQAQSRPGGCLKYGLGGAIVGHLSGGHRVKGALAGCLAGIYQRRKHERAARERAQRNRTAERRPEPAPDPGGSRENRRSPYEDLGLDFDRPRPSGQAGRRPQRDADIDRNRPDFEGGGSFSHGPYGRGRGWRDDQEPTETGSVLRGDGRIY
jgi:hypothetical protein